MWYGHFGFNARVNGRLMCFATDEEYYDFLEEDDEEE